MEPGVKYILEAGIKTKTNSYTISRALVIYHNFMRCIGEVQYDPAMIAAAALHLSNKVGEKNLELDGLVILFYHIVNGNADNLYIGSMKFDVLKKSVITVEYIMQRMLEFTLKYNLAHQYLLPFLNNILHKAGPINGFLDLMKPTSMKFISDFYTSRICLNYKPEDIAIACIDTALHFHGFVQHLQMFHPWHEGFSDDLPEEKVGEMKRALLRLYKSAARLRPSAQLEEILSSPEEVNNLVEEENS